MLKRLPLLMVLLLAVTFVQAQTIEELEAQKADKAAQLAELKGKVGALEGEVASLTTQITNLSGWNVGAFGTLGINFSQFNNWFSAANKDAYTSVIGVTGNGFANLQNEKYFWRNGLNLNVTKTKLTLTEDEREKVDYETTSDVINLTSLYGYKLSPKFAISGLGEYRSSILENFNNPGFLDLGVGGTWTPISDLVVVFHPLNYNFVFADDDLTYESSLGCKIVADYGKSLPKGISWKSNLSAFVSYSDTPEFSNYTWINSLSAKVWKGIGVGFEFGLRGNKQEGYNNYLDTNTANPKHTAENFAIKDLESDDNPLQTYWLLGLTYSL